MKKINVLLLFLIGVTLFFACQKESPEIDETPKNSNLVALKSNQASAPVNQDAFEIVLANLYGENLVLELSYKGGNKVHDFEVGWDAKSRIEGDKTVIELLVSHLTTDAGNQQIRDSLAVNISSFGIPESVLTNPDLWLRVINSSNTANTHFFHAEYIEDDDTGSGGDNNTPVVSVNKEDVKVVKVNCSEYGIWNNLWLSATKENYIQYFIVTEVDAFINYTPLENDLLNIEFQYTYLADSSACNESSVLYASPIKITKLVK